MSLPIADIGIIFTVSGFFSILLIQIIRLTIFDRRSESLTYWLIMSQIMIGLIGVSLVTIGILKNGSSVHYIVNWFGNEFYQFHVSITSDWLAITYVGMTLLLLSLVAVFSRSYLHKDKGYHRFYFLLSLFGTGLIITSFAGTLELMIVGWELVGISSVLLISFFNYRPKPAKNALYTFIIYRCCDVGLVTAAFLIHLFGQDGEFQNLYVANWFGVQLSEPNQTLWIGGLLLFAAAGKAALFPFCSWLPRAMEGPTPSSAIFYGALSVHLGILLLLRNADVFASSVWLQGSLLVIGILTTLIGSIVGRVQNDIKSRLAYGSVSQLGIIVTEIGLGLYTLALIHVFAHASIRTLQILRAPSLLHDYQHISEMLGHSFSMTRAFDLKVSRWQAFIYRFSLERAWLDSFWRDYTFGILKSLSFLLDRIDQYIACGLTGKITKDKRIK